MINKLISTSVIALASCLALTACNSQSPQKQHTESIWPTLQTPELDPAIEAEIDQILSKLTLEQKVGQIIQGDSASVTPDDVRKYRLGSVLSGGNSAPGPLPYADYKSWLEAADAYFEASIDQTGVEIAIPIIWGIDAVHGHTNLAGGIAFPHNIGLGAANNPELIQDIARITALELSVSGHDWTFAPTLAVPQNDRWGRTYEGFSEEPEIVSEYGRQIAIGLQGLPKTTDFLTDGKVISSAKHFIADGGTENGIDQGDTIATAQELKDIHGEAYFGALEAGVMTVMASYSAWNGERMHGHKELLTDVLKNTLNFNGFVVGDWNGHALIPGCSATDCPDALLAGLDMYMAPESWKGLYETTLNHVQSGKIPMERLDDAVRRILRVKLSYDIFNKQAPSKRPFAGDTTILGSEKHREIARQAVRESLVLLKNNKNVLPLKKDVKVLVVGTGADSIAKAAGGWTLSWQGGSHTNDEFPNSQTILDGITEIVEAGGGEVIYDPEASSQIDADVVIAVYGEDPYAEFQGDISNVDFVPTDFSPSKLEPYKSANTPVISVFLSGRPLWTNPEINLSDAFVAAWLPGSEGGGIADVLFAENGADFKGKLSFSWPKLATQSKLNRHDESYDPLFKIGYGLDYSQHVTLPELSEDSGIDASETSPKGVFFSKGKVHAPWSFRISKTPVETLPFQRDGLNISASDYKSQEDSIKLEWLENDTIFSVQSSYAVDFSRESNGAMELTFDAKLTSNSDHTTLKVGAGCQSSAPCHANLPLTFTNEKWQSYRISLRCFADRGVNMASLDTAMSIQGSMGDILELSNIRIESDIDAKADCGDN
ncbi:glycoside hydrolase family 3 protein [Hirschia litorea]|uniref:Glycoside hydrolase family 3 N-terminal domain-containing protein n=1 Tax=Hirschia litorea TaxID=1199156 RepID=A0ABW2IPZ4_9PROT